MSRQRFDPTDCIMSNRPRKPKGRTGQTSSRNTRGGGRSGDARDGGRSSKGQRDGRSGSGRSGEGRSGDGREGGGSGAPRRSRSGGAGRPTPGSTTGGKKPIGGDQIEGRQAVRELLLAGTRRAREVVFAADLDSAPIIEEITQLANEDKVPIREIGRSKFEAMARTDAPQGVLAFAPALAERDLDELMVTRGGVPPFLLIVDGVTDPGNMGALLRVAETAGVTGVVLPAHRNARISPSVTKAAAGAIEYLPIAQVTGVPAAIQHLKDNDIWTVGLDIASDTSIFDLRVATEPIALVVGAEGKGISRLVRERCDVIATIPMAGRIDSLNAATAGAVACFEIVRRRSE